MISETAQEQAALHALGLLDADEASAFERVCAAEPALRTLVAELRETAAAMAKSAEGEPPPALKTRVLSLVAAEARGAAVPAPGNTVAGPRSTWLPWALAALLTLCCGLLGADWLRLQRTVAENARTAAERAVVPPPVDPLRRVVFCPLEPTAAGAAPPRAAVIWDAVTRQGKVRLSNLPPPGAGHDYQLWVVESGHKETISAGVIPMADGSTVEVPFQLAPSGGTDPVAAFALSLERAGGSPTNQGPVLFLGKL